jgi:hypothetical protein
MGSGPIRRLCIVSPTKSGASPLVGARVNVSAEEYHVYQKDGTSVLIHTYIKQIFSLSAKVCRLGL